MKICVRRKMTHIKVERKRACGRYVYLPLCTNSRMIISLMPRRSAFTEEDIQTFLANEWKVHVVED
jgi:allophanate hydrolase subunit 2